MKKKLLLVLGLVPWVVLNAQQCPELIAPFNGEQGVPVNTSIVWEAVDGVPSYQILLGSAAGQSDIALASVGSGASYTPPNGLPEDTLIFVTIVLDFVFQDVDDILCEGYTFRTAPITTVPDCTVMTTPDPNETDVSVFTNISWPYAPRAIGYFVSLGTTENGTDLLNNFDVGNRLSFIPADGLPPQSRIYVNITPYNAIGRAFGCGSFVFTTREPVPLPECTELISPENRATNVPLSPTLEWNRADNAEGYRITVGDTPGGNNILDNAVFLTTSTRVLDFPPNKVFFITIIPYNESGEAIGCDEASFSTVAGCGPFLNPSTGDFEQLYPILDFPKRHSICGNASELSLSAPMGADGYRWFEVDELGNENLISETEEVAIAQVGQYYLEAYNIVEQAGSQLECPSLYDFEVVLSQAPEIVNLIVQENGTVLTVTVQTRENGNYEFAVDAIGGPYQDSNVFQNVKAGNHTFFVREKNGCGQDQELLEWNIAFQGFPKFFTPDGTAPNEIWRYISSMDSEPVVFSQILIFDQYGTLLKEIVHNSDGWDGTYNGRPMPASDYWYYAKDTENNVYKGHFTLKR